VITRRMGGTRTIFGEDIFDFAALLENKRLKFPGNIMLGESGIYIQLLSEEWQGSSVRGCNNSCLVIRFGNTDWKSAAQ
jgi:hypothetical protein